MNFDWIVPEWSAPSGVRAISTTRSGGHSTGPWRSLNLGLNCGDDAAAVQKNRSVLRALLPANPHWLVQDHGTGVFTHPVASSKRSLMRVALMPEQSNDHTVADAQVATQAGQICVVSTADCLPVLFCNRAGTRVAAAHAGWRGLAAGVLEQTVQALGDPPGQLMAWLGPAIGPSAYTVRDDVRAEFLRRDGTGETCFKRQDTYYLFDLYAMARHRLRQAGVVDISGGTYCTYTDPDRFFSYRRDGLTGRMASLVWLES